MDNLKKRISENVKPSGWLIRYVGCSYEGGYQPDDFIRFIQAKSNIVLNIELFKTPVIDLDKFNFERIVKDRARHVMVHYYNGFCKLCEEFELTSYRTVGTTFRYDFTLGSNWCYSLLVSLSCSELRFGLRSFLFCLLIV